MLFTSEMNTVTRSVFGRTWFNLKLRMRGAWKRRRCRPSEATYLLEDKCSTICVTNDAKYVKYCTLIDEEAVDRLQFTQKRDADATSSPSKKASKKLKGRLLQACRYIGQGGATVGTVNVIPSYHCSCDLRYGRTVKSHYTSGLPCFCIHDVVYSTNYYC